MPKQNFSWHYITIKRDTLQTGLSVPDEAAIRGGFSRKTGRFPILLPCKTSFGLRQPRGKGMVVEKT